MKNIAIPNSVVRSKVSPAIKALQAILSVVSNEYRKITYTFLSRFLKEKRTATESRLKELYLVQNGFAQQNKKSFTLIAEDILFSTELSLSAKGIYMMIKSLATFSGFVISKDYFYKRSGMSFKTFDKAWKELTRAKILKMQQHRAYNGKFIYTYNLAELDTTEIQETEHIASDKSDEVEITSTEITALADAAAKHKKSHYKYKQNNTQEFKNVYREYDQGYIRQKHNYTQREYSDEFFESLYEDLSKDKIV